MLQPEAPDPSAPHSADLASQPSSLHHHVQLGSNQDDTTTPLDASQAQDLASSSCSPTTLAHLPAELLLHIVEYVPVDYVLDLRPVCRSFRDAIDGRVLYQYLRRTRLLGWLGSRQSIPKKLYADEYEQIHMLEARFLHIELAPDETKEELIRNPIWSRSYAMFRIDDEWYRAFHRIGGAEKRQGHTIDDADTCWIKTLGRLEMTHPEQRFGALRWCIALDHAVLDLDFPGEMYEMHFDIDINLESRYIRVAWKDMLFNFLKTERALRLLLDEKYTHSTFTFRHTEEDCLRAVRRARLCAPLDLSEKWDRSLERSLRLPPHLYGLLSPFRYYRNPHSDIENDAIQQLLLLRRTALLSPQQLSYLQGLASDFRKLGSHLWSVEEAGYELSCYISLDRPIVVHRNPVAWSDDLREKIEWLILRWREQGKLLEQARALVEAELKAIGLGDDESDDDYNDDESDEDDDEEESESEDDDE